MATKSTAFMLAAHSSRWETVRLSGSTTTLIPTFLSRTSLAIRTTLLPTAARLIWSRQQHDDSIGNRRKAYASMHRPFHHLAAGRCDPVSARPRRNNYLGANVQPARHRP